MYGISISLTRNPKVNTMTPFIIECETASADEMFGVLPTKECFEKFAALSLSKYGRVFRLKVKRHGVGNPPSVCR